jgi:Asp-tRNA(Asn)/Glu-tRNA(Gln) amidotransferase A subunit family amidase
MAYDVARNLEPEWRDHRELLSAAMREYLERAWTIPREAADDGAALAETCRARLPDVLGDYDALVVPAAAGEAPLRSGGTTGDPLFCRAWTLLGVPAISVPGLTGPAGMPVGVQLVGLDERALLDAASRVEAGLA